MSESATGRSIITAVARDNTVETWQLLADHAVDGVVETDLVVGPDAFRDSTGRTLTATRMRIFNIGHIDGPGSVLAVQFMTDPTPPQEQLCIFGIYTALRRDESDHTVIELHATPILPMLDQSPKLPGRSNFQTAPIMLVHDFDAATDSQAYCLKEVMDELRDGDNEAYERCKKVIKDDRLTIPGISYLGELLVK